MSAKKQASGPRKERERRAYERRRVTSTVRVTVGKARRKAEVRDLSRSGMLAILPVGLRVRRGQKLTITVSQRDTIEEKDILQVEAQVVWTADGDELRVGLCFLAEPDEKALAILEAADETAIEREGRAREEWLTLHGLQREFDPANGVLEVCQNVEQAIDSSRGLIGHEKCHIWYYLPGRDKLVWQAGRGRCPRGDFGIENEKLRTVLLKHKAPVLEADDLGEIGAIPEELSSSTSNWIFPLSSRDEFLGLLYLGFREEIVRPFRGSMQFWFCYSLANFLGQAIERCESSHDNHLRADLLSILNALTHRSQMEPVYKWIIEAISGMVDCDAGVFRLYDPELNLMTICAPFNVDRIDRSALSYEAGSPGFCPNPVQEDPNPAVCSGCAACRRIMPPGTQALRTTLWDPQEKGACLGQVCCFASDDLELEGRLSRRLRAVSSSLAAVMESALHQVIGQKTEGILKEQRTLASQDAGADQLFEQLVGQIRKLMRATSCSIFLADPDGTRLSLLASTCKALRPLGKTRFYLVSDTNHLTSRVAHRKKPLAVPDASAWHRAHQTEPVMTEVPADTAYSYLAVPLLKEGNRLLGVIRCSNKIADDNGKRIQGAFHRHDIRFLQAVAEICAPLILAMTGAESDNDFETAPVNN